MQILLHLDNVADAFACVPFDVAYVAGAIGDVVVVADFPLPLKL